MMFFKGRHSEKKNSQDDLPELPLKMGRSNVTYPVRVRVDI
jgi:hypothetical protein